MKNSIDKINKLFDSEKTTYSIVKDLKNRGYNSSTPWIDNYRNDRSKINKMTLEKAMMLIDYYDAIESKRLEELREKARLLLLEVATSEKDISYVFEKEDGQLLKNKDTENYMRLFHDYVDGDDYFGIYSDSLSNNQIDSRKSKLVDMVNPLMMLLEKSKPVNEAEIMKDIKIKEEITKVLKSIFNEMKDNGDFKTEEDFDMLLDWYFEPNSNTVYSVDSGMDYNGDDKEAYEFGQTEGFNFINF